LSIAYDLHSQDAAGQTVACRLAGLPGQIPNP
jgi:hypothetical protein